LKIINNKINTLCTCIGAGYWVAYLVSLWICLKGDGTQYTCEWATAQSRA